jgi:methyl-accepting chemotaxis protein-1 (serine sensor receptor)
MPTLAIRTWLNRLPAHSGAERFKGGGQAFADCPMYLGPGVVLLQKLGMGGKLALIVPALIAPLAYFGGHAVMERVEAEGKHTVWMQEVAKRAELDHLAQPHWMDVSSTGSEHHATQVLDALSLREVPALWVTLQADHAGGGARMQGALAAQWARVEAMLKEADGGLVRTPSLQALLRANETMDAQALAKQLDAARQEVLGLQHMVVNAQGEALASEHAALHSSNALFIGLSGLLLTSLLYAVAAYVVLTRHRSQNILDQVTKMADGDFSGRVSVDGEDEVAQTLRAINKSSNQICELLSTVLRGSAAIQHAAEQLSMGNNDLSERNRRTTVGLEDVVGAVARYATQLEACGKQIESVADTVQALRCDSASNRKHMGRLQVRMNELRRHSRDIGEIVNLIDAIAFRTNILALNASIEASKAGEAGRGFAVVAQEVRALATRSAESSRQIADIVQRSTEDIDLGAALADETGRALEASDTHVDRIHQAITGVAQLTGEGEKESAAILEGVRALSEVTNRNTALVEQLASAGRSLQSQGSMLSDQVGQFRLSADAGLE